MHMLGKREYARVFCKYVDIITNLQTIEILLTIKSESIAIMWDFLLY